MYLKVLIRNFILLVFMTTTLFMLSPIFAKAEETNTISENFNSVTDQWTNYGGTWSLIDGKYCVNSGPGYKSIMKDQTVTDFVCETDIGVDSGGNAGIIFRTSNPSVGIDAYSGYFAGVDGRNQGVVLGKASNGWTGLSWASTPISTTSTNHLKVVVNGSNIKVYLNDMNTPKIDINDSSYISGGIGFRTCNAQANFDNMVVTNYGEIYPELYEDYKYNRGAAVDYATNPDYSSPDENGQSFLDWEKHTRNYNQDYERYDNCNYYAKGHMSGSDCANFISQALVAGGVKQTDDFYFKWEVQSPETQVEIPVASGSWLRPNLQLAYLQNNGYVNEDIVVINSVDDMKNAVENDGIKIGDPIFLKNNTEGIHHSMIVSNIEDDGTIEVSAHSNDRINWPISDGTFEGEYGPETMLIARMK